MNLGITIVIFFDRLGRRWQTAKILDDLKYSRASSMRYERAMDQLRRKPSPSLTFRIGTFFDPIRTKWNYMKILDELKWSTTGDYRSERAMRQLRWFDKKMKKQKKEAWKKFNKLKDRDLLAALDAIKGF